MSFRLTSLALNDCDGGDTLSTILVGRLTIFSLAKIRLQGYKVNEGSVRVDTLVTRKGKRGKGTVGLFLVY